MLAAVASFLIAVYVGYLDVMVRKADNLTSTLFRCHESWEP